MKRFNKLLVFIVPVFVTSCGVTPRDSGPQKGTLEYAHSIGMNDRDARLYAAFNHSLAEKERAESAAERARKRCDNEKKRDRKGSFGQQLLGGVLDSMLDGIFRKDEE